MRVPYREQGPVPPDPYLVAWTRLRRRQFLLRAITIVVFVFGVPSFAMWRVPDYLRVTAIALGLIIAVPVSLFLFSLLPPFLCPRCQAGFFISGGVEIGRTKSCHQCGLVVGSPSPSVPVRQSAHARPEPRRAPIFRLLRRLVLTIAAATVGYLLAKADPWLAAFAIALGVAGTMTTLIARLVRSEAFPLTLAFPLAALLLSALLSLQERQYAPRYEWQRHRAMCPPTATGVTVSVPASRDGHDSHGLVVQGTPLAEVGHRRSNEDIGAPAVRDMPPLRHEDDVSSLTGIVSNPHGHLANH